MLNKLTRSEFSKNILKMVSGTVLTQFIPILASLIIARLYIPSDFGLFSAWLGIVTIIGTMMTCRYDTALAIVEDGVKRDYALLAVFLIVVMGGLLFFIGISLLYTLLMQWEYTKHIPSLLLIPAAALAVAMNVAWQNKVAADGVYDKLILMRIVQVTLIAIFQIGIGFFNDTSVSLCWAFFMGQVIALFFNFFLVPLKHISLKDSEKVKEVKQFLLRYKKFAFIGLPASTMNVLSAQLPLIIVTGRFNAEVAGYLALTMRVLGAPIGLVAKGILDVFKREAAQAYVKSGQCKVEYLRAFYFLLTGAIILIIGTLLFSEGIFVLAFGEDWRTSGQLAITLLPLFAMRFIASPLSYMVFIAEKQHIDLLWQALLLIVTLSTLILTETFEFAIELYVMGYAFLYIVYLVISYQMSKGKV